MPTIPTATTGLNTPASTLPTPPAIWDTPLPVRYVKDIDLLALLFNVASLVFVFTSLYFAIVGIYIIKGIPAQPIISIALPSAVVWILLVVFHRRLGTSVQARKGKAYLDLLFRNSIIVYLQGFHFTSWTSAEQPDEIDFQKHEVIEMKTDDGSELRFQSADGYEMVIEVTIFFNRLEGPEYLGRSLKYQLKEVKELAAAAVVSRIGDLVGSNSYQALLSNKAQAANFVAMSFGGEGVLSDFEKGIGYTLRNPILKSINTAAESTVTRNALAKLDVMKDKTKELVNDCKVTPDEAFRGTQVALGMIDQTVNTQEYKGIPAGVRTFAPGNAGIAIGNRG
jgi:hypothetical protein